MTTKALVIVHGIGEQRHGETIEKLVRGLKLAYADQIDVDVMGTDAPSVWRATVRVRFHEVWLFS